MSPDRDEPFRILVVGDLSGRASRGVHAPQELAQRRVVPVDRDDHEDVMRRLGVVVRVQTAGGAAFDLEVPDLDALHPDALFDHVELFEELRGLRRRLDDPRTFAAGAAELGVGTPAAAPAAPPAPSPPAGAPPGDLLGAAIDATERGGEPSGTGSEIVDALLRELVIPHVTPAPDPRRAELVAAVDGAIAAAMRRVLRDPAVRGVEAAWRGIDFLVRRLETGRSLSLHVLDVTRAELEADLERGAAAALWTRVVDATVGTPGAARWSLILGVDGFGATAADARLCGAVGRLAAAAGAAFVAAGVPELAQTTFSGPGVDGAAGTPPDADAAQAWDELRARPEAAHVALVAPRFLLRLPYGARGGAVERFAFEELTDAVDHEGYLWGSGAFAVGVALGAAFAEAGWALDPRGSVEIGGLPADVRDRDGEPTLQPCAESLLTDREAEPLAAAGLSVLRSIRGRDAIVAGPVRALGGVPLAGPWHASTRG